MRLPGVMVAMVMMVVIATVGTARADAQLARQYASHVVITPDPIPTEASELAAFAKANLIKDRHYDLINGPPWDIHLLGFLAKEPGKGRVLLVFTDAAEPKAPPIASIEVSAKQRIVITKATATVAAGFEPGKTYAVRLLLGKAVLAYGEVTLREN